MSKEQKRSGKIKREKMKVLEIRILERSILFVFKEIEGNLSILHWEIFDTECLITRSGKGNITINRWKKAIEILY